MEDEPAGYRMLWIGDPEVLPVPGYRLDGDVVYATTDDGLPSLTDGWPGSPPGSTRLIEDSVQAAADGQTNRLGRLLAPMAVRYIVVPNALAPSPLGGTQRPAPARYIDALEAQLDLSRVAVNQAYVVYRNQAALPARALVARTPARAPLRRPAARTWREPKPSCPTRPAAPPSRVTSMPAAGSCTPSSADDGWELVVDGRAAPRTKLFGWADGYDTETGGAAVLRYRTGVLRYGAVLLQTILWVLAFGHLARAARRRIVVLPPVRSGEGAT